MGKLTSLLRPECMTLELESRKKDDAIAELVGLLAKAGLAENPDDVYRAVSERERVVSTGIGEGIAIPHARLPGIGKSVVAFGRRRAGLPFNSLDGKPVKLVFLILSPKDNEREQLILLSTLARILRVQRVRDRLLNARMPEDVIEALRSEEERWEAE